ncbi:MAG: glycosyltransferase [Candidatus Rokuibacteriota bacterium]
MILHTEASLGFGGQELRILTEIRWLLDHGWRAGLACQPASRLLTEARAAAIPTWVVPMARPFSLPAVMQLRRVLRQATVDLVHTHSSVDSWVAALAARSLGRAVVRGRHVSIRIGRGRGLVYRLADRVITSGEHVKRVVVAAGVPAGRVVAIPAGLDGTRFHANVSGEAVRAEFGLRGPVVGLVANIRGSKGHRVFLEATPLVSAACPHARFLIVGDGVGFDDVRRRVDDMRLGDRVLMTGFRRDIPEVMAALDVLALPSIRSEAFPQVIAQALAVGTAVVGTTVGGIPEIIRDGDTGRLVPPEDARALADAIIELLHDPGAARAMARRGQALVNERYTIDGMMKATTDVYRGLLG